jgi:hypothetical protein
LLEGKCQNRGVGYIWTKLIEVPLIFPII